MSLCGLLEARISGLSVGRRIAPNRPLTERVPLIARFSWTCALRVQAEAEEKGMGLMRVWHTGEYCLVGGPRSDELFRGTLRSCREFVARYLGRDGQHKRRFLPPPAMLGDGPVF